MDIYNAQNRAGMVVGTCNARLWIQLGYDLRDTVVLAMVICILPRRGCVLAQPGVEAKEEDGDDGDANESITMESNAETTKVHLSNTNTEQVPPP